MNQLLPQPTEAELIALWASPALGAFIHRRLEQMMRFGHTPDADIDLAVDRLPRQAMSRIHEVVETLGRDSAHIAPGQRAAMLRKIEIAGALLLAAHDRIRGDEFKQEPRE